MCNLSKMELNDENLALLAQYLHQTLNPDPNVRRPGKVWLFFVILIIININLNFL